MKRDKLLTELPVVQAIESRRAFLGQCAGAIAGITIVGCGAALLQGCEASTVRPGSGGGNNTGTIVLDVSSLDTDGEALVTSQKGPDGKPVLIVRRTAGEFFAFSMQCTHEQFELAAPKNGVITCPLHGSQFNLDGTVKSGLATQPLKQYPAVFDQTNNKLTVTLS